MPTRHSRRIKITTNATRLEQRRKRIERFILRDAKQLRQEADHLERLSRRLQRDRESSQDIIRWDLYRAFEQCAYTRQAIRQILEIAPDADKDTVYERLFSEPQQRTQTTLAVENELTMQPPSLPIFAPASIADPLADAIAIARSAAGEVIDWTREPLTDMERRMRQRWIEKQLEFLPLISHVANDLRRLGIPLPKDLADGEQAEAAYYKRNAAERRREEIDQIRTELRAEDDEAQEA